MIWWFEPFLQPPQVPTRQPALDGEPAELPEVPGEASARLSFCPRIRPRALPGLGAAGGAVQRPLAPSAAAALRLEGRNGEAPASDGEVTTPNMG